MTLLSVRYQILFLLVAVLAVFYPVIGAPLNPVDDVQLVQWLYDSDGISFSEVFRWNSGSYYRPLLQATYLLDMKLWGAVTSFMHLENILLHLVNSLLVFGIARKLTGADLPWMPLGTAMLFALHPVNTEAVNWISGRSDLLAATFVLGACWFLFHGLSVQKSRFAWFAILVLAPGALVKETAVFFIPAAVFICLLFPANPGEEDVGFWKHLSQIYGFLIPFLGLPLLYAAVRVWVLSSRDGSLALVRTFLAEREGEWISLVWEAAVGFGFYAKKLVIPWPLNFTISHIPDYYGLAGLLLIPAVFLCLRKKGVVAGLFLSCLCLLSSAILVVLLRPSWTVAAERYLYIPSIFFCLAAALAVGRWFSRSKWHRWFPAGSLVLLIVLGSSTFSRNLIWLDNVALFEDAVAKSPDFPFARSVLADLLIQAGRTEEGKEMIRSTTASKGLRNADFLDLKRAELLFKQGDFLEARQLILQRREPGGQLYHYFQQLLAKVDYALLFNYRGPDWIDIFNETVAVHLELAQVYSEPFYYYRLGQLYVRVDQKDNAAYYFTQAYEKAPSGAHYKDAARVLAQKMEGK